MKTEHKKITIQPQELWLELFRIMISIAKYEECGSDNLTEIYACHLRPIQENIKELKKSDSDFTRIFLGESILNHLNDKKASIPEQEEYFKIISEEFNIDVQTIKDYCLNKSGKTDHNKRLTYSQSQTTISQKRGIRAKIKDNVGKILGYGGYKKVEKDFNQFTDDGGIKLFQVDKSITIGKSKEIDHEVIPYLHLLQLTIEDLAKNRIITTNTSLGQRLINYKNEQVLSKNYPPKKNF